MVLMLEKSLSKDHLNDPWRWILLVTHVTDEVSQSGARRQVLTEFRSFRKAYSQMFPIAPFTKGVLWPRMESW